MRISQRTVAPGNVLLCVLCTILVVSLIGGNVLLNCITRYNVASSQVRAWKESLDAAETGGDIAYAAVRKTIQDPTHKFSGWNYSGGAYDNLPGITYGNDNLSTNSRVDPFYPDLSGNAWYRIRTKGTAPVLGLKRVGMDDRMGPNTRGDSLLRKIDFNYDHFVATYGPNGDGVGQTLLPVSRPQVSRRVELIAAPMTPFEAAIKAGGTFYGLGSAAYVDSFRSTTGSYDASVKTNPSDPRYPDSHSGTVEINSSVATIQGSIYGNLYTNGGTITKKTTSIFGIIDNNVPFSLDQFAMPSTAGWNYVSSPTMITPNTTINPPVVVVNGVPVPRTGTPQSPNYYLVTSFANNGNLTVNPATVKVNGVDVPQETYVAIHVTGDIGQNTSSNPTITVPPSVHLQVYFDGNFQTKAQNIVNTSGYAGNLQFYAISPTLPNGAPDLSVQQTVNLNSGGGSTSGFSAVFYTPSANFTINGAPDITGAIVCKNFYGNGNVHWHYDRALDTAGDAVDYRILSYVEDIR